MANFLLIHGSCHGAWCWQEVCRLLAAHGHCVKAIDLPSHGVDTTDIKDVTLASYAQAIAAECGPRTILVGHSMGGYAISAAARLVPDRITRLIYVCAYVPKEGVSMAEMRKLAPRQPIMPAVRMRPDGISFEVDQKMARDLFYNDCPNELARRAIAQLCPQATAPTSVPFHYSKEQLDLPRTYIRCMNDQTIPPEFQVTMTQDWPNEDVMEMSCGHSPFFADPKGLVDRLETAART